MKRTVSIATAVGFVVPIFWGVVSFLLFGLPESRAADIFWGVVYITCPPWLIPTSSMLAAFVVVPLLNALLYGWVTFMWCLLAPDFRRSR
jgi:hypothetical protein